jgi:hypothetical protein
MSILFSVTCTYLIPVQKLHSSSPGKDSRLKPEFPITFLMSRGKTHCSFGGKMGCVVAASPMRAAVRECLARGRSTQKLRPVEAKKQDDKNKDRDTRQEHHPERDHLSRGAYRYLYSVVVVVAVVVVV